MIKIKQAYVVTILTQLAITLLLTACFSITALIMSKESVLPASSDAHLTYTSFDPNVLMIVQVIICLLVSVFPLFADKTGVKHKEIIWYEIPFFISTFSMFLLPFLAEFASSFIGSGQSVTSVVYLSLVNLSIYIGLMWAIVIPLAVHITVAFKNRHSKKTLLLSEKSER